MWQMWVHKLNLKTSQQVNAHSSLCTHAMPNGLGLMKIMIFRLICHSLCLMKPFQMHNCKTIICCKKHWHLTVTHKPLFVGAESHMSWWLTMAKQSFWKVFSKKLLTGTMDTCVILVKHMPNRQFSHIVIGRTCKMTSMTAAKNVICAKWQNDPKRNMDMCHPRKQRLLLGMLHVLIWLVHARSIAKTRKKTHWHFGLWQWSILQLVGSRFEKCQQKPQTMLPMSQNRHGCHIARGHQMSFLIVEANSKQKQAKCWNKTVVSRSKQLQHAIHKPTLQLSMCTKLLGTWFTHSKSVTMTRLMMRTHGPAFSQPSRQLFTAHATQQCVPHLCNWCLVMTSTWTPNSLPIGTAFVHASKSTSMTTMHVKIASMLSTHVMSAIKCCWKIKTLASSMALSVNPNPVASPLFVMMAWCKSRNAVFWCQKHLAD